MTECQNPIVCKRVMAVGHAVNMVFYALSDYSRKELDHQFLEAKDNPLYQALMNEGEDTYTGTRGFPIIHYGGGLPKGPSPEHDWTMGYVIARVQYTGTLPGGPPFDVLGAGVRKLAGIELGTLTELHWFCTHENPWIWPDQEH